MARPEDDISQDNIDKLLSEAGLGGLGQEAPAEPGPAAPATADAAGGQDEIDALLQKTMVAAGGAPAEADARPMAMEDFGAPAPADERRDNLPLLMDVNLSLKVELGRTKMYLEDILKLGDGSVVELDKLAGDPLDILVNDRLVARGEVLVLNENFCVRITEIVSPEERVPPQPQ